MSQHKMATKINKGDKLVCYMTKLSRWIGVLEVMSTVYIDDSPRFYEEDDPFIARFRVQPLVWLERDSCIPIHEASVWENLSFTRELPHSESGWTGIVRRSLNKLQDEDGDFLEKTLILQDKQHSEYPVDDEKFERLVGARIRREDKTVTVTVPSYDEEELIQNDDQPIRQSCHIQALLASCGESMGYRVWLPKSDRGPVLKEWSPKKESLIEKLPLNYDDTTLKTIEQIDVLWLKGRAIVRAFEVEHTTAVYSGILRMADLLALQPNMDIKLHIVAEESRKQKVFNEIQRPVFSLLARAPLYECCTFLSYDSLEELLKEKHLEHLSDSVLDDYSEEAE